MAINTHFDVNVLLWGLRGNALSGHLLVWGEGGLLLPVLGLNSNPGLNSVIPHSYNESVWATCS